MAQYNFEGDLDAISERQLEFINKVVLEQDLKANKVIFEPVGQAGDNFIANVKRITLEGDNGTLKMIAKVAPAHEAVRQATNTALLFTNEHVMYTEVLPKLVQLQKSAGVPEEERLRYAKFYGSLIEAPNEIILLEDLKELDFAMLNKFESLSDECVRSILKDFAILHSLSYALKKQEQETFDLFKDKLKDMWSVQADNAAFSEHMQHVETDFLSVLDDDSYKSVIKNKIMDIPKLALKSSKYEYSNKHSVIQQGDSWTNNIMFKYEGNKLLQSIMIDYQVSKNSSPVADILYMVFNCTDHETRTKNFYDWIDYYHSELDKSLSNFSLKANFVYPRDQLDADMKRYGKLMFGMSLILTNVLSKDSKEAGQMLEAMKNPDLAALVEQIKVQDVQAETMVRIKKRLVGLIDSFKEFGLL